MPALGSSNVGSFRSGGGAAAAISLRSTITVAQERRQKLQGTV
ncbi:MAG TPA: hypothetical protein VME46_10330 [Acidimicrobiales bacterium]|nr:hypothetical protein [Acidimicrobiales bacterium]